MVVNTEHLEAEISEKSRGDGHVDYDLCVTLKPTAPPRMLRRCITLVTDDAKSPQTPVLVTARIEADITVTPDVVVVPQ